MKLNSCRFRKGRSCRLVVDLGRAAPLLRKRKFLLPTFSATFARLEVCDFGWRSVGWRSVGAPAFEETLFLNHDTSSLDIDALGARRAVVVAWWRLQGGNPPCWCSFEWSWEVN